MAIDRRIVRTRTALYAALVALIRERDYDNIRLEDILQRANVGRSTFYTHFRSKDDLLARSLEQLRAELTSALEESSEAGFGAVSRALFHHIDRHRDIGASLAGRAATAILRQAIAGNFAQVIRTMLPPRPSPIPRELAINHVSATFLCVLEWWLDRNPSKSWKEADRIFREIISTGVIGEWPELSENPSGRR